MNGWLDWREIELQGDWGLREKTDAMGEMWNEGAAMWDARWKRDLAFTRRQADALDLRPEDSVLDVGCGTGPLTVHVAPRVREVVAFDYGRDMLRTLEENLCERGVSNVRTLQGNWHTMEPGVDLPVCDVAITRWSPAQGDILKFSRCARRWCYSLSSVSATFAEGGYTRQGFWCRSTVDEDLNTTPRPCGRKFGFNVQFNLLYDHGVNPTVNYLVDERTFTAPTVGEVLEQAFGLRTAHGGGAPGGQAPKDAIPPQFSHEFSRNDDGSWTFCHRDMMVVMGWDPRELRL